ncbi:hypothetical protein ACQ4PT_026867 [Festuca glaucescens]
MSRTYPFPLLLLLAVLVLAGEATSKPTTGDQATLLVVKEEWGNPPQLASWDPTAHADHCSYWMGVVCEGAGSGRVVTGISLASMEITGVVPASVCDLKNLTCLDLSDNNLTGRFPGAALYACSKLRFLDLSSNHLSGPLPESLCADGSLRDIVVFNNSLSGELPKNLGDCVLLNSIMLYNNRFSGEIPAKVWSLPKLTTVMIQNNGFTGALPATISGNISRIEMGNNQFSGSFPTSATGLHVFKAENNLLSGDLPVNMSKFPGLVDLSMSGNQLTGSIPASVNLLQKLNSLDMSDNRISGTIPPSSFGSLPSLTVLDLSGNELTGRIPADFGNLNLNELNLSSNQLSGEVPVSLQRRAYENSFLGNGKLCARKDSGINLPTCRKAHDELFLALITVFSTLGGLVLAGSVGLARLLFRRRRERQDVTDRKMTHFTQLRFTESDVLDSLREENAIGSGRMYRVNLPSRGGGGGRTVAVKKICNSRRMESELKVLGNIRHNNIVKLLCCISSTDVKLLVYEYMENGSLDRWLHHREREGAPAPLDWPTRLTIAIDSAKGLSYMHHNCAQPIVHGYVRSSNILLDPEFHAKIAGFGLAGMLVNSGEPESVSAIEYGYRPGVNEKDKKVDVYSFGVVLLELTTGKVANDGGADLCLAEWAQRQYQEGPPSKDVFDEHICDPAYMSAILSVFTLGVICTGKNPPARPSMEEVLRRLIQCDRRAS